MVVMAHKSRNVHCMHISMRVLCLVNLEVTDTGAGDGKAAEEEELEKAKRRREMARARRPSV